MRNSSDKSCGETANSRVTVRNMFKKNCVVYKITCKNNVEPERTRMTMWRMRIACWISKATDKHSEYVTITAFPLQQWLHERHKFR